MGRVILPILLLGHTMLRPLQTGFLNSRLIGFTATTAASATNTIQQGSGEATFTNASSDHILDHTYTHPFGATPVQVVCAGAGVGDAGTAAIKATASATAGGVTTLTTAGAADVGQSHSLIFGQDTAETRRSGNKDGKLFDVRSSRKEAELVIGQVSSAGAVTIGGREFTVTKNGTGDYTVTFTPGFGANPIVVATPVNAAADGFALRVESVSETTANVLTFNDSGAAADAAFNFVAMGFMDRSDYALQKGGLVGARHRKPRIVAGKVTYTAGVPAITIGTGEFTLTDVALGELTVTFDEAFARTPVVIASAADTNTHSWVSVKANSSTAITLEVTDEAGAAADPAYLNFLVFGSDSGDVF